MAINKRYQIYLILLVGFVFFYFNTVNASLVIFSDGFEDDFSNWTGNDIKWTTSRTSSEAGVHGGLKRAQAKGDATVKPARDEVLLKNISTEGSENIGLSFWYRIYDSLEVDDHVYIEWTADSSDWNILYDFMAVTESDVWTFVSYPIPSEANDKVNFAIRFRANLGSGGDIFYLDDVVVSAGGGNSTSVPTPISTITPTPQLEAGPPPTETPTPASSSTSTSTPTPMPTISKAPISTLTPTPTLVPSPSIILTPNISSIVTAGPMAVISKSFDESEVEASPKNLSASISTSFGSRFVWWAGLLSVFGIVAFIIYRDHESNH